ncbi:hypothetical protein [Ethanoligenens harbinense]|uniref:Uncharacterized protein n=1 Tax=Ethanoligenens harbinense (strain DSM 18485 / JCM 12961 / CGMCC 1.5033 / YUAN-3) TaxID=663278 RepID=E6U5Z6_ETHHY|nr:hypothetical protein [Ethanoligenens harbinense]ADU25675.1 hypothetical protein Ethha_0085 [Ethanoligenens harbinense YUAN-3]ADU26090.1 hypothetical protein Ethha_0505 [Ethanoligenens harbinense YUAN-3]AVQ94851.1 hypothetical protein CXQ68_00435 [Ethanoligenens harbinense YUAN-3]AVQ95233.1 hypothetical protein CXQ68_02620 [Ethanoligenens harbinense YUAN-3]AYF37542.1 hypothetical protein CXP51_00440 [Ethanoligenens harbinense]
MNASNWLNAIPPLILSVLVGIIGFFLKRTIGLVDRHETEISAIKDQYVTKEEMDCLQDDLKSGLGKLSEGIDALKDNYMRKDDFVRAIADVNRRQDRIFDVLLEMKGDKNRG